MATVEFDRASSSSSRNEGRGGRSGYSTGKNSMDLDSNNSRELGWMYGRRSHEVQSEEEFVEVTLDVHDDSIVLRSVAPAPAGLQEDPEVVVMEAGYDKRSSRSSSFGRSTSSRIKQFSQELKAEASAKVKQFSQELKAELRRFSWSHSSASRNLGQGDPMAARLQRRQKAELDRNRSGAQKALKGLRFISNATANAEAAQKQWSVVEKRFYELAKDGLLSRADFAQCIGMKDTKEFAVELFDALARRKRQKVERISKDELYEMWSQISDQSFDSRLQIFFDMYAFSQRNLNWGRLFRMFFHKRNSNSVL